MNKELDIILLGATGYTGTLCIESLHKFTKLKGHGYNWGIAGRSEEKLKECLEKCGSKIGADLSSVPIIKADVNDIESLKAVTSRAKVLINCTGPYKFCGEAVVKACIETGTHQVDVSGEPVYIEMIRCKYSQPAEEKGIYIVSACGFDSVPADLGILYLQQKFEGTINSVEAYVQITNASPSFGTYQSLVNGVPDQKELAQWNKKLYPTDLPEFLPKLKPRFFLHKSELINKWCVPFMGSDLPTMQCTQRYLYEHKGIRPLQIQSYVGLQSNSTLLRAAVLGPPFLLMAHNKYGRSILLKYPSFFTGGAISSHEQPLELLDRFSITFQAEGWNETLPNADDVFASPPNKKMVTRVTGNNPLYIFSANAVTLAAIVILSESKNLPKSGGVYTPAAAFRDTSLMQLLQENDLNFEIL